MRMIVCAAGLLLASCAHDPGEPFAGRHAKNGGPERHAMPDEIFGHESAGTLQCGRKQVRWCSIRGARQNCRCVWAHEAARRLRQSANRVRGPGSG